MCFLCNFRKAFIYIYESPFLVKQVNICTFAIALVSLPVIFLQILAANAVDAGGNSLITVFKPETPAVNSFTFSISI